MNNLHTAEDKIRFPWDWPLRWQYALALALVTLALLVRYLLNDLLGERMPFLLVLGVLLPLVQLVRPQPFMAAALFGWLASVYLFLAPSMSLVIESPYRATSSAVWAGIFLLAAVTAVLSHRARDLRERDRRALLQAEAAASHLAAIVDGSDDAIISKRMDSTITSWNKGAERLFGYSEEEAVGRSILMLLPPDRQHEKKEILGKLAAGERVQHFDTVRIRKDGVPIDVSLTVSPMYDARGRIVGASKIARDITERKKTEEALRDADRRKDEFLATLAHELRNPLAAISLAMHVLDTAGDNPARVGEMAALIQRQSSQLKRLIDDLMDVGRISRGKVKLERKPFDAIGVIREVVDDSLAIYAENGVNLSAHLSEEPLIIEGDSVRFAQVMNNLLNNASKFTERDGDVKVNAEREGDELVIRVSDTGVGIPPDQLERVFEMFAQVEDSPSMRAGGLGIGLSLARSIIEMQGGDICARSEGRGKGAEFIVRMPLLKNADIDIGETNAASAVRQPVTMAQNIVAADDNPDALKAVALTLRMRGHSVHTARDGIEALEMVQKHRPEIALLDIGMPGMDGYEVARNIRQEPWGKELLLIAMTGWGQEKDKAEATLAGFDIHLTKPVDLNSLEELFRSDRSERKRLSGSRGMPV